MTQKKQVVRFTLAWRKLYLYSCATYYTAFVIWLLDKVTDADTTLVGNCNTGATLSSLKGYYGKLHMWVNENGMANFLSIPCLEEEGYYIEYARDKEWVVKSPREVVIPLKRDTCLTKGMLYIYIREWKEGVGTIQTERKKFDNFTSEEIEKGNLYRKTQLMAANPTDERSKTNCEWFKS